MEKNQIIKVSAGAVGLVVGTYYIKPEWLPISIKNFLDKYLGGPITTNNYGCVSNVCTEGAGNLPPGCGTGCNGGGGGGACRDIICSLITSGGGRYQEYKTCIGREPDCGDADWLCNQGISTEQQLVDWMNTNCPL